MEKVLGNFRNPNKCVFKIKAKDTEVLLTKREKRSYTSSIFDTLGILKTIVLGPKFIIQSSWKEKFNCNIEIHQDVKIESGKRKRA